MSTQVASSRKRTHRHEEAIGLVCAKQKACQGCKVFEGDPGCWGGGHQGKSYCPLHEGGVSHEDSSLLH